MLNSVLLAYVLLIKNKISIYLVALGQSVNSDTSRVSKIGNFCVLKSFHNKICILLNKLFSLSLSLSVRVLFDIQYYRSWACHT